MHDSPRIQGTGRHGHHRGRGLAKLVGWIIVLAAGVVLGWAALLLYLAALV
jgi:hypothetical protein